MAVQLRVLLVEDVEWEAELVLRELKRSGFDVRWKRVDDVAATRRALEEEEWDLVISDYSMNQFDAPAALGLLHELGLDIPFIIVSGTIGEETAVASMRAGAHDYFHKDKLGPRFLAAIERELAEAKVRREQAETERALHQSRERVDRVLAHSRFMLFSWEPTFEFIPTFVSPNIEQVMGYTAEECFAPGWWSNGLHPEDHARVVATREKLFATGQSRQEFRFRHKDGSWRWISDDQALERDPQGAPTSIIGSWSDVTERKLMQKQLMISDRMASLGTLAAGVAHEINNPLAALIANLDHAAHGVSTLSAAPRAAAGGGSQALPDGMALQLEEVGEVLRDAREAAERVRLIVRDLKLFSRSEEETRGPIDIRQVVESALRMAWNEVRHRARLVRDFEEVPTVLGNEARLGQVFLNLVVNAAQAIPEGRADRNEVRIRIARDAPDQVIVEVRDTGSGIPEPILNQIFDPFFTTKSVGEGTGLGLAICHRIVSSLGGRIEVDSQVGEGTTFRTLLPVGRESEREARPAAEDQRSPKRGRILVVDDEPSLGAAIRRMLAADHEVVVVTSVREALALVSGGGSFDAILCDLMMPELTGMDLHAELALLGGDLAERMIFMTGGAFTSQARNFLDQVPNARVDKPFEAARIRSLIDELLR